jgi:hypothetical protein
VTARNGLPPSARVAPWYDPAKAGRPLDPSVVLPGELIDAICDGGHRATVVEASIGEACWSCGEPLHRPDHVDEALANGRPAGMHGAFARVWTLPDEGVSVAEAAA